MDTQEAETIILTKNSSIQDFRLKNCDWLEASFITLSKVYVFQKMFTYKTF